MNEIKIFTNSEFGELGVLVEDGKEMFPATECARILGYSNPHDAIRNHCKGVRELLTPSQGGEQLKNFISEGDLFRLIIKSKLPAAERFEKWVFEDVLPTIRKHGIFATEKVLDEIMASPELGIRLLSELKAEREKRKQLEAENAQDKQIICELQPKVNYYDMILQNPSLMPITLIAKDYGMSAMAFNLMLQSMKIQYKMEDNWVLYQRYADNGYTHLNTIPITDYYFKQRTFWTQKGRLFLYDFLKNKHGILPMIERESYGYFGGAL